MNTARFSNTAAAFLLGISLGAQAQTQTAPSETQAMPSASAAAAAPATPAEMPVATPAAAAPAAAASPAALASEPVSTLVSTPVRAPAPIAPAPVAPPTCAAATDGALDKDMDATMAQSRAADLGLQAKMYESAVLAWTDAVALCSGRAQDRAQNSLADAKKALGGVRQQLGAGDKCLAFQKNGADLQELARKALAERRWSDSALLFKKSATNWDLAAERCDGDARLTAQQRREQADLDGFNSENCAPIFEQARAHTMKLRAMDQQAPREQKQEASQITETLWRSAIDKCKGSVQDIVKNNANSIARDRGTPWVAKYDPVPEAAAVEKAAAPAAKVAEAKASLPGAPLPTPAAVPEIDVMVGSALYVGKFVKDARSGSYSGNGRITWINGESYAGDMVQGKREGNGKYTWSDGRKYEGDWRDDKATGNGQLSYPNGNHYKGAVVDGVPLGQGTMSYASGDSFSGEFKAGNPEGKGTFRWKNSQQFDGDWSSVNHNANGTLKYPNRDVFVGTLTDGLPSGKGLLRYASGDIYEGQFNAGLPDGQGSYHWVNGASYSGDWKQGLKNGHGVMVAASGERVEGEFANDKALEAGK